ncbi:unnamed protein product [Linum trigynum]|uniref:Uncharacterized protein n=1 Tax=Linum trigynum TaxID=586398 RepID=A0AAV2CLS2_9ROSI
MQFQLLHPPSTSLTSTTRGRVGGEEAGGGRRDWTVDVGGLWRLRAEQRRRRKAAGLEARSRVAGEGGAGLDSNVGRQRGGGDLEVQSRGVAGGGRPTTARLDRPSAGGGDKFGGDGNGDRTAIRRHQSISERERFGGGLEKGGYLESTR